MTDLVKALAKPFPLATVGFKPQTVSADKKSAMIATYIDARAVVERLDEVFPLGWEDTYIPVLNDAKVLTLECSLTVHADGRSITRRDVGESRNGDGAASRWKSATSDAFKRAAVKYGIGGYLYRLENVWVEVKEAGRSVKITSKGLKAAETAYLKAVEALGLKDDSEKSQGQIEEPESPVEPPQQVARTDTPPVPAKAENTQAQPTEQGRKLTQVEAGKLWGELEQMGYDAKRAYFICDFVANRKVDGFTDLTLKEADEVLIEAKYQKKNPSDPPFKPDPPEKHQDFDPHKRKQPTLTKEKAAGLHKALGQFGCKDHPKFVAELLKREVESFTDLTVAESVKVYEGALEKFGEQRQIDEYYARKAAA